MSERVRPCRVAIVAGALVALQVVVAFLIRPVPDKLVSLLGGPSDSVDRIGGLRLRYRPPAGLDPAELERYLANRSSVRRENGVLVLDFPAVAEDMAPQLLDVLTAGGLTMREARESAYAEEIARDASDGITLEIDRWRPEEGGETHAVGYLVAPSRELLERAIAEARARGWRPAPGSEIAFEQIDANPERRIPAMWRTYELVTEVAIDGTMIANAVGAYDPNTNRPIVLLDFTREGADRFCELTGRIAGNKLATVLGDRVRSAPIINGRICGGRASITMGGSDPMGQEAERDMLVAVLSQGAVPRGGTVESKEWHPPADVRLQEWAGRVLLGLVAGGLFGLLVALVIRVARPQRRAVPQPASGKFPIRRLIVTLLAPVALIVGGKITLPGINEIELLHVAYRGGGGSIDLTPFTVIALGMTPILSAFAVVELVALAIPRLRWRRHDPRGRVRLGQAVAALAIVVALVQSYFVAVYLESLSRGGAEIVIAPGWKFRILTMITLTAGTMLLGVVAGLIREHGLGNGYGVLIVSSSAISFFGPMVDEPAMIPYVLGRGHALGFVTLIAIAIATAHVLRWRIAGAEREAELRLPTSGTVPLSDAGGLMFLLITLSGLGLGLALSDVVFRVADLRRLTWLMLGLVVVFVPIWSWLFSRPSLVARVAMQAGVPRPARSSWFRATLVSGLLLVAASILHAFAIATDRSAGVLADPVVAMLGTAVVLDIIDDARARRRALAPAGVLHQIQYAGVVERVLADAGIPCHIHASNLRTLLGFFGPWAPAIILVPEALAADARGKLDDVLRPATGKVPVAQVRAS